ncbi:uncharacterized protein LOC114730681 [Neltuma alba]|uniref:uncharacterized protein LOC114730681 n=1 Tax=Neltuma alba TaxID=207710 RepID=UPI0010A34957|nr:uncharacterized protein LOC114730681 [Prosopis alba]
MVGKTIKVDRSTSIYDKGSFARICVEIDLQKPLLPAFTQACPSNLQDKTGDVATRGTVPRPDITKESAETCDVKEQELINEGGQIQIPMMEGSPTPSNGCLGPQMLVKRDFRRGVNLMEKKVGSDLGNPTRNQSRIKKQDMVKSVANQMGSQKDTAEKTGSRKSLRRNFGKDIGNSTATWIRVGSKRKNDAKCKRGKENKNSDTVCVSQDSSISTNPFSILQHVPLMGQMDMGPTYVGGSQGTTGMDIMHNNGTSHEDTLATPSDDPLVAEPTSSSLLDIVQARDVNDVPNSENLDFLALVETRADKSNTEKRIGRLGFQDYTYIEAEGYSGGIWCLWNTGIRKLEVLERNRQFIHFRIENSHRNTWVMTVIYASPNVMMRRNLWGQLARIASVTQEPWLLGGDFNATLLEWERRSSATYKLSADNDFCRWFDESNLQDLGYSGPDLTWKRGTSEARLDRFLANEAWCQLFPQAKVAHLPFYKSDHRPLLLRLDLRTERPRRPFRFIASWILHDNFNDFVRDNWKEHLDWQSNITQFTDACRVWNKQVFGHIQDRKRKLMRRLDGVTRAIARGANRSFYENIQLEIWKELESVIAQESLLWAQKARVNWAVYGDHNSKLFHAHANKRRKVNRVDAIRLEDGAWCYDTEEIKQQATNFFSSLFQEDLPVRDSLNCRITYPPLDEVFRKGCERAVDEEEIKSALFSMGPLKSPGPDGFNALFFQNQWGRIRNSLVTCVQRLFDRPDTLREINGTLIVLIPKKDPPETLKDLRPISLCNVVYKIVTKIMANRIKTFLPQTISPNQCGFVPGRLSSDNIIVAQEVIHSMRNMKGKKGFMAIKIDLEKAYDCVNWNFLIGCLKELQLPNHFVDIISSCVSTADFQLLWNGDKAKNFSSSRGVRQGDPISPYLFVICMEKLAHIIQEEIEDNHWRPIRLTKTGPPITHLFFADDVLLFAEANLEQADLINQCLEKFSRSSGLKVNHSKTRIFFSMNINHNRCSEISGRLGFTQTSDLGKYLGVNLHHSRVNKGSFQSVVDKVKTRLSKWKTGSLSLAGRTTLISSVMSAIPNYTMQTSLVPSPTCETLDKLNRGFLWGSSAEHRKMPLVAWDAVCQPKSKGGLGLRHTKLQNQALLMKLGWRLVKCRDDFWVKVLRDKYRCGDDLMPKIDPKRGGSNIWAGIKATWERVAAGIECLADNTVKWKWERNGLFSVKSAYDNLSPEIADSDPYWKRIWKLAIPQRCRTFIWLASRKSLLTNTARHRRGLSMDDQCPICHNGAEDVLHVLRDCTNTWLLWKGLVNASIWKKFCSLGSSDWLRWNLNCRNHNEKEWGSLFAVVCWWLWRRRNLIIFEGKELRNEAIIANSKAILSSMHEIQGHLRGTPIEGVKRSNGEERWRPPDNNWIKVNVDGAYSPDRNISACGGLLRNMRGEFLRGFIFHIGQGDALTAELQACLHGLKVAWDEGYRNVILESDATSAIELLSEDPNELHDDYVIIREARALLTREWNVKLSYAPRSCNQAADLLAKLGLGAMPGVYILQNPPQQINRVLDIEWLCADNSHVRSC